jgi:hypothetical protein
MTVRLIPMACLFPDRGRRTHDPTIGRARGKLWASGARGSHCDYIKDHSITGADIKAESLSGSDLERDEYWGLDP